MQKITLVIGVLALILLAETRPAQAWDDGPWCSHQTGGKGLIISRCDFRNFEACRAWNNAQGGSWCTENPYYWSAQPARRNSKRGRSY
jgi:hypothetical protein